MKLLKLSLVLSLVIIVVMPVFASQFDPFTFDRAGFKINFVTGGTPNFKLKETFWGSLKLPWGFRVRIDTNFFTNDFKFNPLLKINVNTFEFLTTFSYRYSFSRSNLTLSWTHRCYYDFRNGKPYRAKPMEYVSFELNLY